jgi:nitrate/nitrite transport system substrate-binding protein
MKHTRVPSFPAPSRRTFLTTTGATAAGVLLSDLPRGWSGGVYAADGPETSTVRFGIIALTDCAPIVMAHELGYFKKFGIDSVVSKEASWAVIRDKLSIGDNHATHMLLGMPLASTMGLAGSPVKPMVAPWMLNRNGQAITLNNALKKAGVRKPSDVKPLAAAATAAGEPLTFAMTFPTGTHAMWLRYWLASGGIHPDKDVNLITIPPPQMVANMKVDKMDGYCVGEPWNNRAIEYGIGFIVTTTQTMWKDHPEKVCAFTEEFAAKNPRTVKAVLKALHLASVDLDKMENRPTIAEVIARPAYINCPTAIILERLMGKYEYGDGRVEQDPFYLDLVGVGDVAAQLPTQLSLGLSSASRWRGPSRWSRASCCSTNPSRCSIRSRGSSCRTSSSESGRSQEGRG